MNAKSKIFSAMLLIGFAAKLGAQPNAATQLWEYASSGPIAGSPAIGQNGTVYFATAGPALVAVTNRGSNMWTFPIEGGVHGATYSSPAVSANGTIYVSGGSLYAVNP